MGNYGTMPSFNLLLLGKAVEAGLTSVFKHSKDSIDTDALFFLREVMANAWLLGRLLPLQEASLQHKALCLVMSTEDRPSGGCYDH